MSDKGLVEGRLEIVKSMVLRQGAHPSAVNVDESTKMCALEAVAWMAGEPWSDAPKCACPVIATFVRSWNDGISDDDRRTELLQPLLPLLLNTRSTKDVESKRAYLIIDWEMRMRVPAFIRLYPSLEEHAAALESMPEIRNLKCLKAAREIAGAAQRDAVAAAAAAGAAAWDAAGDAAWAAARDAAWVAAWDAARAAAGAAERAAAGAAAGDAAWAAARDAAGAAARSRIAPTVATMQASAQDLVRRLCAVSV